MASTVDRTCNLLCRHRRMRHTAAAVCASMPRTIIAGARPCNRTAHAEVPRLRSPVPALTRGTEHNTATAGQLSALADATVCVLRAVCCVLRIRASAAGSVGTPVPWPSTAAHHHREFGRRPSGHQHRRSALQGTDDPKNTRGGNNTAVSLGNNAALPLLMAGLGQTTISWLQCLQNAGKFLPHPVCATKRPIPISRMGRSERRRFWGYDFGLDEEEEEPPAAPEGVDILPLTRDIGSSSTSTCRDLHVVRAPKNSPPESHATCGRRLICSPPRPLSHALSCMPLPCDLCPCMLASVRL